MFTELETSRCRSWVRFHFNVARRRRDQDDAPPPQMERRPRDHNSYPAFEIFHDKDAAREAETKREATLGKVPTSWVVKAWLQSQAL